MDEGGEAPEAIAKDLVVVVALGVARDPQAGFEEVGAVAVRGEDGDEGSGVGFEVGGVVAKRAVIAQVGHLTVAALGEPLVEARTGGQGLGGRDGGDGEAQSACVGDDTGGEQVVHERVCLEECRMDVV